MDGLLIFALSKREAGHVAQLDRASDYESEGLGFDSLRDHYLYSKALKNHVFKGFRIFNTYIFTYSFQKP